MALHINDDTMTLEIGDGVVASARFSRYAAADGNDPFVIGWRQELFL